MSDAAPLHFTPPLAPEDAARADLYGLVARLFYAPPDGNLLSELRLSAPEPGAGGALTAEGRALAQAWTELVEACAQAFPARLEEEHLQLFAGIGKAEVTPYLSAYLEHAESDRPLARLRGRLAELGLARRDDAVQPEDHIAAVCEVMRWLIAGRKGDLDAQRQFFEEFLRPGAAGFCAAVSACENARFYRHPARLLQAFLDVEHSAFGID